MDNKPYSRKMINQPRYGRLKPLSECSRMITCGQKPILHHLKNLSQVIDFKIEVVNNCVSLDKTQSPSGENKESVSSQLHSDHRRAEDRLKELKNTKYVDEDKGYFSLPNANSSPLPETGELVVVDEYYPSELQCHEEAAASGQPFSFLTDEVCPTVSGPLLEPVNFAVDSFNGDCEEMWNIGRPIFESSACHDLVVTSSSADEQSEELSAELQEGLTESIQESKATANSVDTTYETTPPLKRQVKSKLVVPSQPITTTSSKPVAPVSNSRSRRPVIFSEVEWERKKEHYVALVTRHMDENPGANHGAVSELVNLMTHVADQAAGSHGERWQHPSDFTRRNYQKRFRNTEPKMTLHEWRHKNLNTHKRFSKVPKIFERSPFP